MREFKIDLIVWKLTADYVDLKNKGDWFKIDLIVWKLV